ncbi:MAG: hypothetical protein PHU25_05970 [Deltaproteobacteria bacterium]|nr:hypothetical protein [Deltaproteobacteria bacterium]
MKTRLRTIGFLGCVVAGLVAGRASADSGAPPSIHSLIQKGQDVVLQIAIADVDYDACHNANTTCELIREGPQGKVTVFDDPVLSASEPVWTDTFCYGPEDMEGCDGDAGPCYDCDGDSIAGCHEPCFSSAIYEIVDGCVPPGETRYTLLAAMFEGFKAHDAGTADIAVEDTGDPCIPGESACSVVGVGSQACEGGLALVMLLVGTATFVIARRRR